MADAPAAGLRQIILAALAVLSFAASTLAAAPPCDPVPPADIRFEFSAEPPRPTVGDDVAITVRLSNPGGSAATRPHYALLGFKPLLDGDLTPTSTGASTLGSETLTYHVKAVRAGTASLVLTVNYSTPAGCRDAPITQFTNANSAPFALTVIEPPAAAPTACATLGPCGAGFTARCADEAGCVCTCVETAATPKCDAVAAAELSFEFAVDPPRPTVGDTVTLSVIVRNTTEGVSHRPQYSLQGAAPIFSGDFSPTSGGAESLGNDRVSYRLTAAEAGNAQLRVAVGFETVVGCRNQPQERLTNVESPAFAVEVTAPTPVAVEPAGQAPAPPTPAATAEATAPAPAAAPIAPSGAPAEMLATPTATKPSGAARAQRGGGGCGGSCSTSSADGAWPLVLLLALLAVRRRRSRLRA